jgi:hypothetical protein
MEEYEEEDYISRLDYQNCIPRSEGSKEYWFKVIRGTRSRGGWLECRMIRIREFKGDGSVNYDARYNPTEHVRGHYMSSPYNARIRSIDGRLIVNKCGSTEQWWARLN